MFSPKLILSPVDFSDFSLSALDEARDIAKRHGAEILLVNIVPEIPKLPENVSIFKEGNYENELIESAKKRLAELAAKLVAARVQARSTVGLANDVAMEIVRIAESEKVDLIVIATHGMTGWRRLAFGSVTDKVVRTADCPVLVLRNRAATTAA